MGCLSRAGRVRFFTESPTVRNPYDYVLLSLRSRVTFECAPRPSLFSCSPSLARALMLVLNLELSVDAASECLYNFRHLIPPIGMQVYAGAARYFKVHFKSEDGLKVLLRSPPGLFPF